MLLDIYISHSSTANPDTAADLWIGAHGSPNDDIRWASSNQLLDFSDWWPNDPNYGFQEERCVILWRYRGGLWADTGCGDQHRPLCEYTVN